MTANDLVESSVAHLDDLLAAGLVVLRALILAEKWAFSWAEKMVSMRVEPLGAHLAGHWVGLMAAG